YQNGFTRAHAFESGRDGSMAKFVSVAPRLSLTGMSADEWIAAKPGTEFMLALAMAQVILGERLAPTAVDARGLERSLPTPQQAGPLVGMEARDIRRLAREFAASDLVLPDLHPLEQWSDSQPRAGVHALQQPVMQTVFPNTRHTGDVLLQASGSASSFKEYLQTRWRTLHQRYGRGRGFDDFW